MDVTDIIAASLTVPDGQQIGLRVLATPIAAGDLLDVSHRWTDGEMTPDELDGTSAIGLRRGSMMDCPVDATTADRALRISAKYPGAAIAVIAGTDCGSGEDVREVIIRDARVIAVWMRR
jgi:hypothetical protein